MSFGTKGERTEENCKEGAEGGRLRKDPTH